MHTACLACIRLPSTLKSAACGGSGMRSHARGAGRQLGCLADRLPGRHGLRFAETLQDCCSHPEEDEAGSSGQHQLPASDAAPARRTLPGTLPDPATPPRCQAAVIISRQLPARHRACTPQQAPGLQQGTNPPIARSCTVEREPPRFLHSSANLFMLGSRTGFLGTWTAC